MGNLETRIMFLIVLLGALWLMLSKTGRLYIANFAAVISGNNIISGDKGKAATITKTGTKRSKRTSAPHKSLIPVKDLIPAHKKSIPAKDLIPAHTPNKGLIPVHKFLGGLYPAP